MPDRRLPAFERKISEISEKDIRVRVLGTVIDKQGDFIILDDGTGKIKISMQNNLEANQFVRVIGKVMPLEDGLEIQGELAQDMSKLDMELVKTVEEFTK